MIYKHPDANEQRRFRYHKIPLSSMDAGELDRQFVRNHYRQTAEDDWRQEYIPKVKAALRTLSSRQMMVIELYIYRNMEQEEIAHLMDCSQQAVSRLYKRAISKIRDYITE
jgi:RNA polymerase sigma factor (sigma-70 family)